MKIALQLYTLRNVINNDVEGMFKRIKAMGYEAVEFAGFYNYKAEDMNLLLKKYDLVAMSSHTSFQLLEDNINEVIDYNRVIGNQNIVIPHTPMKDEESYKDVLPRVKKVVNQLTQEGFNVYYHNHGHEFNKLNDVYLLDMLLSEIPELRLELDVYWAVTRAVDVTAYILKHKDRIDFIHAKDMTQVNDTFEFESLGDGIIDYTSLYHLPVSYDYWIIENDKPKDDGFENIKRSINHLKKIMEVS